MTIHFHFFYLGRGDPIAVGPRGDLAERPDAAVVLGAAPDGLPLVLSVKRRSSIEATVLGALGLNPQFVPPDLSQPLQALEQAVAARARRLGIEERDGVRVFRTQTHVGELLGRTLLARALGSHSPLVDPEPGTQQRVERLAYSAELATWEDPREPLQLLGRRKTVALDLDGDACEVVAEEDLARGEPVVFESLRAFPSARYHGDTHQGLLRDAEAYEQAVWKEDRLAWSLERADLGAALVRLARSLEPLHRAGRVHADVKPDNALVGAEQALMADPIGVAVGATSPGASPGWAAPEQVLVRPVGPATDVFGLGLIAVSLLGAVVYGEERSFVTPTGGTGRARFRLLAQPEVWLDPTSAPLADAARAPWSAFLARCVAFDPEQRPADAASFAAELADLLQTHPLQGAVSIQGGPGTLRTDLRFGDRAGSGWVLTENR